MAFDLDDDELRATREIQKRRKLTADAMFENLGYEKIIEGTKIEQYEKEGPFFDKEIIFNLLDKYVTIELGTGESSNTNIQELRAINKKCKELGWL